MGITSAAQRQRRGAGKKPGPKIHDDHVQRLFSASRSNQLWLADITEHRTRLEGKLYVCAIKDVYSNRIVGYSIASTMTQHLVADATTPRRSHTAARLFCRTTSGRSSAV